MGEKEIVNIHFKRVDISRYLDICPDCFNEIWEKAKAIKEAQEKKGEDKK